MITRMVEPLSSIQLGHVTLDISLLTSLRNFFEFSTMFTMLAAYAIYRYILCQLYSFVYYRHQSLLKLAGQEGLEPPTAGFGDRCSTN